MIPVVDRQDVIVLSQLSYSLERHVDEEGDESTEKNEDPLRSRWTIQDFRNPVELLRVIGNGLHGDSFTRLYSPAQLLTIKPRWIARGSDDNAGHDTRDG